MHLQKLYGGKVTKKDNHSIFILQKQTLDASPSQDSQEKLYITV